MSPGDTISNRLQTRKSLQEHLDVLEKLSEKFYQKKSSYLLAPGASRQRIQASGLPGARTSSAIGVAVSVLLSGLTIRAEVTGRMTQIIQHLAVDKHDRVAALRRAQCGFGDHAYLS